MLNRYCIFLFCTTNEDVELIKPNVKIISLDFPSGHYDILLFVEVTWPRTIQCHGSPLFAIKTLKHVSGKCEVIPRDITVISD